MSSCSLARRGRRINADYRLYRYRSLGGGVGLDRPSLTYFQLVECCGRDMFCPPRFWGYGPNRWFGFAEGICAGEPGSSTACMWCLRRMGIGLWGQQLQTLLERGRDCRTWSVDSPDVKWVWRTWAWVGPKYYAGQISRVHVGISEKNKWSGHTFQNWSSIGDINWGWCAHHIFFSIFAFQRWNLALVHTEFETLSLRPPSEASFKRFSHCPPAMLVLKLRIANKGLERDHLRFLP